MWNLLKSFLFLWSAEKAHHLTMKMFRVGILLGIARPFFPSLGKKEVDHLPKKLLGLNFLNPVGLAAGFDKDGKYFDLMGRLGFGFVEIGTITPEPQAGNEKPRLFRLPKDEALINRMGFNNDGIEACKKRLETKKKPKHLILGINIGKNKWTPNEEAYKDYVRCFEELFDYADYFVVNVSSPNTPNLRALQDKEPLSFILNQLQDINQSKSSPKPLLLKIAPDMNQHMLKDIADIIRETNIDGLILTNTTIDRSGLKSSSSEVEKIGAGGLSGQPLTKKSLEMLKDVRQMLPKNKVIISVGGIANSTQTQSRLSAGADLVQVYTGLIYEGPRMVRIILKQLKKDS